MKLEGELCELVRWYLEEVGDEVVSNNDPVLTELMKNLADEYKLTLVTKAVHPAGRLDSIREKGKITVKCQVEYMFYVKSAEMEETSLLDYCNRLVFMQIEGDGEEAEHKRQLIGKVKERLLPALYMAYRVNGEIIISAKTADNWISGITFEGVWKSNSDTQLSQSQHTYDSSKEIVLALKSFFEAEEKRANDAVEETRPSGPAAAPAAEAPRAPQAPAAPWRARQTRSAERTGASHTGVNSLEKFLEEREKACDEHNLTDIGKAVMKEFWTFKYHSLIQPSVHAEARQAYYNLVVYSHNQKYVVDFAKSIMYTLARSETERVEYDMSYILSRDKEALPKFKVMFTDKKVVFINNNEERPPLNTDAGTGSAREESIERREKYDKFWQIVAEFTKENPTVTFIVGMTNEIYLHDFKLNNELNYRIFGHRVMIPEESMDMVIDYCVNAIQRSSLKPEEGFMDELRKYIETIYKSADLQERAFAVDVINRIYSNYFKQETDDGILRISHIPQYNHDVRTVESAMAELNAMTGLEKVKKTFAEIYKKQFRASSDAYNHMVFYGNPGTGKTHVAGIAAEMLFHSGVLKKNKCTKVTIEDLISPWRNNTSKKVKEVIDDALDGVLFIDEAYGLLDVDAGSEVVTVLIQKMQTYKDRLVVILAGYKEPMDRLMEVNAGLKSRIGHELYFEDYSVEELAVIFKNYCNKKGYTLDESADQLLIEVINARKVQEFFGNAREMQTLFEDILSKWYDEYYEEVKQKGKENVTKPKIFYKSHFEDVAPPKNAVEINKMIGLTSVKEQLEKFKVSVKYRHTVKEWGMKHLPDAFMHMVFMGNPGTGKTTVAQYIAEDLYSLGVLKTNRLVVAERKDIICGYRPSVMIEKFVKKAIGGVLFIDEAYSLLDAGSEGIEAVEALLTAMVEHREDTIFIFAGYPRQMMEFLDVNPGLISRIGYTFRFEDYNSKELVAIFKQKMSKAGFTVSPKAVTKAKSVMDYFSEMPNFGNGRFVDQLVASIIAKRAERTYDSNNFNQIEEVDIPEIGDLIGTNSSGRYMYDPKLVTKEEKLRTTYHEMGHAIAICTLPVAMEMQSISMEGHSRSLGRVEIKYSQRNCTEEELKNEMVVLMAGRSAEKVLLGGFDQGCSSDYSRAKRIAADMIEKYGMGEIGKSKPEDLLAEAEARAVELVKEYEDAFKQIAKLLLKGTKHKEYTAEEFKELLAQYKK